MKITIIIPTYNEKENIGPLIDKLETVISGQPKHSINILVVDDNSPDKTQDVVEDKMTRYKNLSMVVGKKEGLGKALLRGMEHASGKWNSDYFIQMDADFSHDPAVIPSMIQKAEKGHDFIIGTRYIPGGSIPSNWGIHRKILSIYGNYFTRLVLGHWKIHDWTTGYRMIRREIFEKVKHELKDFSGYTYQASFLHKSVHQKAKIGEVPINFIDRKYGKSKMTGEYFKNMLMYIVKSRIYEFVSPNFLKVCIVGVIGFIINTIGLEVFVKFGLHPSLASAIGAEVAIFSNFTLNNFWSFKDRKLKRHNIPAKFIQFNIFSFGSVVIQAGTIFVGTHFFGIPTYRLFYIIGVAFGLLWNYTIYSKVIWKKR